jgi:Tol biopolymer transport system component
LGTADSNGWHNNIGSLTVQIEFGSAGFNVDSLVTFVPLSSTFRTVSNPTGCPAGFVGKFTFSARLTNKSSSPAMPGLDVFVQTLTNGNVLLDPQTNAPLGGAGAIMEIPKAGQYADGLLSANETVDVPFVVCLKTLQSFQFFVDVFGVVTELVSINQAGTSTGNAFSSFASLSTDGRFVAFESAATDLAANDTNGDNEWDVFVRDLQTGTTELVSVNAGGTASGNSSSGTPTLSANGRFVAFVSVATDLVTTPTNGTSNVFVRDLQTGNTTLVSVNAAGTAGGNGGSGNPALSADGHFVAFQSVATDLVTTPTNGTSNVFVRDLQTGTTTLVSVNAAGTNGGNASVFGPPVLSADGRFVAFVSGATDLAATPTNGVDNVFVRDLQTGTTELVSVNAAGTAGGNGGSDNPALSADGRFIAFQSVATDLVTTPTNGSSNNVFVRDLQTGTTTLVSVNRFGTNGGNGNSSDEVLSPDGRFVAFVSSANDLVANDTSRGNEIADYDVFVRDLLLGTTTLVSVNGTGTSSGNAISGGKLGHGCPGSTCAVTFSPSISSDGRFVAFVSSATDLTPDGVSGQGDAFVRDLQTGTTTLVSVNRTGTHGGNASSSDPVFDNIGFEGPLISANGRFVVFGSLATDLVGTPDTNAIVDLFARPVQQ